MPGGLRREDIEKDVDLDYAREMIIVFISGVNSLGGSFYVNSPVTGNWDDFITHDVVGYMDAHYRTLPKPASRGLSGNAVGGAGALNLAMLHPDVFGAVYSLSPSLFDNNGLAESPMFSTQHVINDFVDLQTRELLLPVDEGLSDMQHNAGDAQFTLAYGAAFAPNSQAKPPYVDYPYYRQNGQLFRDETIWKRWEAGFGAALDKIQAYNENLLKLSNIGIDYSTNDPYIWVPKGCEYFAAKLTAAGIPNQVRRFSEDPHTNLEQRIRQFMLPFFSEKLEFDD
jgi:S-formylglutathione hydrolase FrmB